MQTALFKRGVPRQMYVDNGSNYCAKEFSLIFNRIGTYLSHTPVKDGAAKGKIERFFKTVRAQFLLRNLSVTLNGKDKQIIPIIDDAQLIPINALRKLRLLLEDFPKNHNLVLLGQPDFNTTLQLRVNEDIRSRITYSATVERLAPEGIGITGTTNTIW